MITAAAAVALVLVVVVLGLAWQSFDSLFLMGNQPGHRRDPDRHAGGGDDAALARHAELAEKGAIIKRLWSVETLGSTRRSAPTRPGCRPESDDGRRVVLAGRRYSVDGEGTQQRGGSCGSPERRPSSSRS